MAVIGWGKCRIFIKDLETDGASWVEVPTPVEESTQLSTEKGDKQEATLEGGEYEDVRYSANKYSLEYQIRIAKDKTMPFTHDNGRVSGTWAVAVQPEDAEVAGVLIDKSVVSCEDTFSTAEGGAVTYTHDALKPDSGNLVKWAYITVTEEDGAITDLTATSAE